MINQIEEEVMANVNSNIFEDLGFDSEVAANLKIRAELILELREYINQHSLTQSDAAKRLGIKQPEVSAINTGKLERFTIDQLVTLLTRIGHTLKVESSGRRRTFTLLKGSPNRKHTRGKEETHDQNQGPVSALAG
jgi:predicted XRE-type DNA-binding protein